ALFEADGKRALVSEQFFEPRPLFVGLKRAEVNLLPVKRGLFFDHLRRELEAGRALEDRSEDFVPLDDLERCLPQNVRAEVSFEGDGAPNLIDLISLLLL